MNILCSPPGAVNEELRRWGFGGPAGSALERGQLSGRVTSRAGSRRPGWPPRCARTADLPSRGALDHPHRVDPDGEWLASLRGLQRSVPQGVGPTRLGRDCCHAARHVGPGEHRGIATPAIPGTTDSAAAATAVVIDIVILGLCTHRNLAVSRRRPSGRRSPISGERSVLASPGECATSASETLSKRKATLEMGRLRRDGSANCLAILQDERMRGQAATCRMAFETRKRDAPD